MVYTILFLVELVILSKLSNILSAKLFNLYFWITKNKERGVFLFSITFLPGTFIHEVSHFLAALVLLVPAGEINLIPKIDSTNRVKMGEVSIAKTDVFRRFIIGTAPFIFGTVILLLTAYFWSQTEPSVWWKDLLAIFLVFEIGNTMFASKKDLEGAMELFLVFLIFSLLIYAAGVDLFPIWDKLDVSFSEKIVRIFRISDVFLLIPLVIDLLVIFLIYLLEKFLRIKI